MRLDNRRILVTGGAGFIGSHAARKLHAAGATVLIVDNCFAGSEALVPDGVSFEAVDLRDDRLREVVLGFEPDAIVHLAAIHYIPYCNENPEETFQVNVMGTRKLLSAARDVAELERFVFASSAAVYPSRTDANSEDSPTGPMDIYGETKLIGEDLAELFAAKTGVSTAVARLFNVYGPNETNEHLIPAILKQVRAGERRIELGNLSPKRDFVHVSDVTRAIATLLREFEGTFDVYNVGTGTEYSVREVVEKTSTALGEDIEVVQDDERVRDSDRPHLRADVSKLHEELDWEPQVEFVSGLRELLEGEQVLVR
jgi:UDP-glucose 4-epimerase